jgi:acyltransferase
MQKNRAIFVFKGIAIIGVVAHHLANRRFTEPMRGEIVWFSGVTDWVVPAFILVSGYLHGLSHMRKCTEMNAFVISRARRLMLPFVIVGIIYGILYSVLTNTGILRDPNGPDMFWWQRCWACLTSQPGGVGEQLYFFPFLFVISCMGVILLTAIRYKKKGVFASAAVMFALALLLVCTNSGGYSFIWPLERLAYGIGLYLLGFGLSTQKQEIRYWSWVAGGAVLLLLLLGKPSLVQLVFPVLLLSVLLAVDAGWTPLERVGEAAGTIFLYHTPFVLQPMLILIAARVPAQLQVIGAYAAGLAVVLIFTIVHLVLAKTRLKWVTV